jgi:hypothetical protein
MIARVKRAVGALLDVAEFVFIALMFLIAVAIYRDPASWGDKEGGQ